MIEGSTLLLTGASGSFGNAFCRKALTMNPHAIRCYSRDELKQAQMRGRFNDERLRFVVGDVRDLQRLHRAAEGCQYIIHAAALKRVDSCQYNPCEAVKTNIMGAVNVIEAALDCRVHKVLALSTDKAVHPVNLYGKTKAVAEDLFMDANAYGGYQTKFSCTRYGNVVGSRGSVIPIFKEQAKTGTLTITDPRMTRFWLSLEQGVEFVLSCLESMKGGEIFVPKIPSMAIMDLAKMIAPDAEIKVTGIRAGEKLHEVLLTEDEARNAMEYANSYVIQYGCNNQLPDGFRYSSDQNTEWLSEDSMKEML